MSVTSHPGAINDQCFDGDFAELFQSGSETLDVCISKDVGIWEMAFIASVAVA
jgi:hypothetical protein